MTTHLIVPDSAARREAGIRQCSRLTWTTDHSQSRDGCGVLLYCNGDLLDAFSFRGLRDTLGALILTTDAGKVCRALGLPVGEARIEEGSDDELKFIKPKSLKGKPCVLSLIKQAV
jgi:hypothetical protein